jgi:hypothetical protein
VISTTQRIILGEGISNTVNTSIINGLNKVFILSGWKTTTFSGGDDKMLRIDPYSYKVDSNGTERYQLTANDQLISSPFYGPFDARFIKLDNATVPHYGWIQYYPANWTVVPTFVNAWEVLGLICTIDNIFAAWLHYKLLY